MYMEHLYICIYIYNINFFVRKICFCSYLFHHLLILYNDICMYIYFILCIIIQLYVVYFAVQSVLGLVTGSTSKWVPVPP